MIMDFKTSPANGFVDADVCLIGSGAAGLTLAHHLPSTLRVLIVEAGDREPRWNDDRLSGEVAGPQFDGFENGRARAFGGATRLWFGQCIRLDPIDFEKRDWVPYSGWPIGLRDLGTYYDRAETFLGLERVDYHAGRLWSRFGLPGLGFDAAELSFKCTAYCPQPDFIKGFGKQLVRRRPNVSMILNATAVGFDLDASGRMVTSVQLRGEGGREGAIRSRTFVLCGGGIENPRLLLASNDVAPMGIGNERGLVGRFFQDHPSGTTGVLATAHPRLIQRHFRKLRCRGVTSWPKLALADALQRRRRVLNANCLMLYDYADGSPMAAAKGALEALKRRDPAASMRRGAQALRHLPELVGKAAHARLTGKAPMFASSAILLKAHVEQGPDPANRVSLSGERDQFGTPRARLTWRIHPDEIRTLREMTAAVDRELRRLSLGKVIPAPWLDAGSQAAATHLADTYHHAGTTRMGASQSDGVVDAHCRVFGTENVYVAGSSVFPTSGYANPTLTIVALAIRLSDHLSDRRAAA